MDENTNYVKMVQESVKQLEDAYKEEKLEKGIEIIKGRISRGKSTEVHLEQGLLRLEKFRERKYKLKEIKKKYPKFREMKEIISKKPKIEMKSIDYSKEDTVEDP